ncbi:MAG: helix-turn-helix transcriptional regulator [Treponema sp.]|nr:helix-turn-helix transcriptional regulator [Treponema sp.]
MTLKQIFIRNLKEFRKTEGISQMKLAVCCDISPGYIGEIESGRKFPSTEMIEKIALVLRIEPYQLFRNPNDNTAISKDDSLLLRLPYNIKKQIKVKIKNLIKTQIKTQINTQVNLSMKEIISELNGILDGC